MMDSTWHRQHEEVTLLGLFIISFVNFNLIKDLALSLTKVTVKKAQNYQRLTHLC